LIRHVDLARIDVPRAVREIMQWLAVTRPSTLNVAGPRASDDPLIYAEAKRVLSAVLIEVGA
jgi:Circularly permutated YpsA SLOG family